MRKLTILLTVLFSLIISASAQWQATFTHYSSEEGLSQNSVMKIIEDHKGFMWFATWDGINKFDGYTFKTYKASEDNAIRLVNNRVDHIAEDQYGYIWTLTYDSKVYRFDPRTEIFQQVPASGKESYATVDSIIILDRHIWLLTEKEGAIRVTTDSVSHDLSTEVFSLQSGLFPSMSIYTVRQDSEGNEWLLSDNGIGMIRPDSLLPVLYFMDAQSSKSRQKQAFYCFREVDDYLYFGSGKGRVWLYQKENNSFRLLEFDTESDIISINSCSDKDLIIATRTDGFYTYDTQSGHQEHYTHATHRNLPGDHILSVYVDRKNEVWFDLENIRGVTHFNPSTQQIKQEVLAVEDGSAYRSQPAFFIFEDINDNLWVHPFNGGFSYFDREKNRLIPFHNEPGAPDWRFSNKVHAAMSDRQGNLWMCTHSKGLEKISFITERFHLQMPHPLSYESLSNDVRSLYEDNHGRLWMGLRDGKIRIYEKNGTFLGCLTREGTFAKNGDHSLGVAYHIYEDSKGNIWIATKGDGLYKAQEEQGRYRITQYHSDPNNLYSLSDDNIYCVHEDSHGRIWIATFGGGLNYMEEREDGSVVFINHQNNLKGYPIDDCYRVRFVTTDSKGYIWVGSTSGAISFPEDFTQPEEIRFDHHVRIPTDKQSLSHNDVYWITETTDGNLYLATFGGGLNKLISVDEKGNARFETYNMEDGLPSNILLSMREDDDKNLWISTENGLCKFIPSEERADNYNDRILNIRAGFNEASSIKTKDGKLIFGTRSGWLTFDPKAISKSAFIPPVAFTRLQINNEEIRPGRSKILEQVLDEIPRLTLSHKENILTIQYAALDMKAPENIRYAYIMEGFDNEWTLADKQRMVTYTNLPKGDYVFKVRSTNNDGVWVENDRGLPITILPSFWETPWAYALYVLLILGIIFVAVYILFTIYRLKHEVSVEQQVSDIKLRFFTNISHELRTPLTLIAGPVEHILQNDTLAPETREQLQLVEKNTDRMLRLVNQILDFRKIQNKKMKMKVEQIELESFIRTIMDNFEALATEHQIDFIFESEKKALYLWADADHLEKIIFNLLSNAFKYTPVGKMIRVYVLENEKHISIGVQDQGIGIAANKKESLFVRFENLVDRNLFNQSSSGIGLSLVKELVEMHGATISVDSILDEGSTFEVAFLKGKEHYDASVEFILKDSLLSDTEKETGNTSEPNNTSPAGNQEADASRGVMLLVEDNGELRTFLRTIFASSFRIAEAKNGKEGLEKALSLLPDIIISDVMMPDKDGLELTRELRENLTTSHIPIILLTAKTTLESKLEGMEYGANDYITKPFSSTYLKARVDNLLVQHKKLQELYRTNLTTPVTREQEEKPVTNEEISPNDRKFIDRLVELMEKNMDNGELVVEDLVQELAVSRSVFFKKLKALTGLAPIEFIREMRVKRAAELIETGEYSISQVSYMVGINDPRYFSKCFKQKYGMTPTEYKENKKYT
ncbi:signal transduction histidine kinase/ligand-binding sensor domain-containing protein/DNA-binding response OmpR family regulator [Parabacteroides sp. PFB2-12]|uniref:two-component regulator propeller domain-containing protein n=1 Tax=unclassified Parabacteroides TaxID=2649774 RepID=UPI002475EA82|nr:MULTISPECIES: two-component regulator propeller domain-containing protein [unclassified Parabacteroides]MDH6342103.1 signal transduction histidine kinase/ligand-binding sensor domain-containing protein/DNA-binding response OmpR family regulator [Parabacteroides sp. PM6-13]MDH6389522.1 signal transduction histidine kinase/ligand-binding sensor domain-containing protein/DNA-binding response OmpR family regulator [Parabacteroides sp. PFB2-12]